MDEVYIRTEDMASWVVDKYFENSDFITLDEFYRAFEDLSCDYEMLEEKFEDFKQNVEENYRQIDVAEQIGYHEDW